MDEQNKLQVLPVFQQSQLLPQAKQIDRTVLVIAENPALLVTIQAIFKSSPFRAMTTCDTISGLAAVVEHKPLAIFADAETGPLDVWRFCALLKQHADFRHIHISIISSKDDVVARAKAKAYGVDQFISKPFTAEELLQEFSTEVATAV